MLYKLCDQSTTCHVGGKEQLSKALTYISPRTENTDGLARSHPENTPDPHPDYLFTPEPRVAHRGES